MRLPSWHLHLDVWVLLAGIEVMYLLAMREHRRHTAGGDPHWKRKVALFSIGMAVLWIGSDWPIHDLSERYLYSVHMLQHLLFTLVAPPLIIAGMPVWMVRVLLRPKPVSVVFRFLTKPVVALLLFNGVLLFIHWPAVVDLSVHSELAHFLLHSLIFGSAIVMWWPVMSPLPELPSLPLPAQMLYLFLQSLAPTIPASFLTFGSTPIYTAYVAFPRIWGISVMDDQLLAGLTMKLLGGAILWGFIATIFFRWFEREHRDGLDPLQWRNVDREVRTELVKR